MCGGAGCGVGGVCGMFGITWFFFMPVVVVGPRGWMDEWTNGCTVAVTKLQSVGGLVG